MMGMKYFVPAIRISKFDLTKRFPRHFLSRQFPVYLPHHLVFFSVCFCLFLWQVCPWLRVSVRLIFVLVIISFWFIPKNIDYDMRITNKIISKPPVQCPHWWRERVHISVHRTQCCGAGAGRIRYFRIGKNWIWIRDA